MPSSGGQGLSLCRLLTRAGRWGPWPLPAPLPAQTRDSQPPHLVLSVPSGGTSLSWGVPCRTCLGSGLCSDPGPCMGSWVSGCSVPQNSPSQAPVPSQPPPCRPPSVAVLSSVEKSPQLVLTPDRHGPASSRAQTPEGHQPQSVGQRGHQVTSGPGCPPAQLCLQQPPSPHLCPCESHPAPSGAERGIPRQARPSRP